MPTTVQKSLESILYGGPHSVERWNSTSQTQGTAGNREAGGFVNCAVRTP